MSVITNPDAVRFLAAIADAPDEDTPRLAFADYLDGLDTVSVPCPKCKGKKVAFAPVGLFEDDQMGWTDCPTCDGTGTVPDTSNRDRAELIRVQVELSRLPVCGPESAHVVYHQQQKDRGLKCERLPNCRCAIEARERALLAANSDRWRRGPVCERCRGKKITGLEVGEYGSRGCPDCWGTGDAGGLMRVLTPMTGLYGSEPVKVTYHRGFPRVECRAGDVWERWDEIPLWRPTKWARAVCLHPDVLELWPTDLTPDNTYNEHIGEPCFCWWRQGNGRPAASLPSPIFDMLIDRHAAFVVPRERITADDFETADAAHTALARVLARWVRRA